MIGIEKIDGPLIKPNVEIDKASRKKLLSQVNEEAQVIVHCTYAAAQWIRKIRIWKSTFLYAKNSEHRSKLVHTENITLYPEWMNVAVGETVCFTLIFTGLPKNCKIFDLVENIPEPGGFEVKNIKRNNSDVYIIKVS